MSETPTPTPRRGFLDRIEWLGNKLPDPSMLFVIGAALVMVLSALAVWGDWSVQPKVYRQAFEYVSGPDGQPLLYEGEPRVRLRHTDDGQPVLELVSDARRIREIPPPTDASTTEASIRSGRPSVADESPGDEPVSADESHSGESVSAEESQGDESVTAAESVDETLADEASTETAEPAAPRIEPGETIYTLSGVEEPLPRIRPVSLLTSDGIFWCLGGMVRNFLNFAPLGVVLVGMLGIGIAEKSGMLPAVLKAMTLIVPRFLLTPMLIFLGVMSSIGMDAGYIVLPPLAAALYKSLGRSPLVGIGAVFAGIAGGFNANLFVTSLDPLLAGLTTAGANVIDPDYAVTPTCNLFFMMASTALVTLLGWAVSSWIVEPRFNRKSIDDGGPQAPDVGDEVIARHGLLSGLGVFVAFVAFFALAILPLALPDSPLFLFGGLYGWLAERHEAFAGLAGFADRVAAHPLWVCLLAPIGSCVFVLPVAVYALARGGMTRAESLGLAAAASVQTLCIGIAVLTAVIPGAPLHGVDPRPRPEGLGFDRWVASIVPLIFLCFLAPGLAYGAVTGVIRNGKDLARMMTETMANMAPIIVLAFFAAQFIEYFRYSQLDRMLAMGGGLMLAELQMPSTLLIAMFVLVVAFFNLLVASMSAKYAMMAPIFVPMLMMAGISPELTQAAYRIGDSITNVITPLNAYMVVILMYVNRYVPKAGLGTVISMMLPYTLIFGVAWLAMLILWVLAGWTLGIGGPLTYVPS